ncbi:DUF7667 family protein [Paenibacillus mesophilus]|jgi:hypothetical protein|uniref:DUF7667 family protein n=1 Tax=Paenibacillus mesophilus TaxID=2582849 RepID=UPI0030827230
MTMTIHPAHRRMAELWTISRKRKLTQEEQTELDQCLQVNAKLCWEMAGLENASLLASMTRDTEWQHEICRLIDGFPWQAKRPDHQGPV